MKVDVVFDGPPGPEAGRFVEVERADTGESMKLGEWVHRDDGYWTLRFDMTVLSVPRVRGYLVGGPYADFDESDECGACGPEEGDEFDMDGVYWRVTRRWRRTDGQVEVEVEEVL